MSGLPAVVSTPVIDAQPLDCVGYIAAAGTHIDCLPIAALTNVPDDTSIPSPSIASVIKEMFDDTHDRINDIALTGDVTGTLASATQDIATSIGSGVIVNDDVNASAAIAQSKLNLAITTSEIAAGTLVLDSETITSNDNNTTIPTSAAVKNYVDAETATLTNKTLGAVTLSGAVTGGDQTISAAILKDYAETDVTVTSGTTLAIDLANGNVGSVTLAHSVTDVDFTNVPGAGLSTFTLIVTQDGTGSRTMATNAVTVNTSAATVKTAGGSGLTLSTAAAAIDIVTFMFLDAGTTVFVFPQLAFA